jgi:hypothetical protein
MQPMLTAYARLITGKSDVRVVMDPASNGMTDGKRIMFKPPIELGDMTPHKRDLCDKRDGELQQLCRACAIREGVFVTIFHEIGHIAHDSFARVTDRDKADAIKQAVEVSGRKYAEAMKPRLERVSNYQSLTGLVSPFLPYLVNCLEDARINAEVFKARKGARVMFKADTWRIFTEGIELPDGTYKQWREMPLNQQAAIGVFCLASGYDPSPWLADEVAAALHDSELINLCSKVEDSGSAAAVYHLAFPILARLRELGFMKNPNDPQSDEEDSDDDSASEGDPSEEAGEPEGDDAQGDGEGGGDAGGEAGDDSQSDPAGSPSSAGDSAGDGKGSGPSDGADRGSSDPHADHAPDGAEDEGDDRSDAGSEGSESGDEGDPQGDDASSEAGERSDDGAGDDEGGSVSAEEEGVTDGSAGEAESPEDEGTGTDTGDDEASGESGKDAGADGGDDRGDVEDSAGAAPDDADSADGDGEGVDSGDDVQQSGGSDEGDGEGELGSESGLDRESLDPSGGNDSVPDDTRDDDGVPDGNEGTVGDGDGTGGDQVQEELRPIDTGADEGYGGIPVDPSESDLPMGEPDDLIDLHEIAHPEERPEHIKTDLEASDAIEVAVVQGIYFETSSVNINGVREHHYDKHCYVKGVDVTRAWRELSDANRIRLGVDGDFDTPESVLGPALLHMRVAFSDNQRGKNLQHRKSGKVNTRVLGRRAHLGDERLFKKRIIPGKRDYFVLIGFDISGSTSGLNLMLIKRAAFAQAELCHRLGIKFAIYAHTGSHTDSGWGRRGGMDLDIYHIKGPDEAWSQKVQKRLVEIGPSSCNLDGHTLEFYRKVLDTRTETDRIILYYTDGKMPAENHDEELQILQREIKTCRKKNYTLLGVGIRTNSPTAHGLDTVQVDTEGDTLKVIKHLEKRLLAP